MAALTMEAFAMIKILNPGVAGGLPPDGASDRNVSNGLRTPDPTSRSSRLRPSNPILAGLSRNNPPNKTTSFQTRTAGPPRRSLFDNSNSASDNPTFSKPRQNLSVRMPSDALPAPAPQRPGNWGQTIALLEANTSLPNNASVSPGRRRSTREEIERTGLGGSGAENAVRNPEYPSLGMWRTPVHMPPNALPTRAPQRPGNSGRAVSFPEINASPPNSAGISPGRQRSTREEIERTGSGGGSPDNAVRTPQYPSLSVWGKPVHTPLIALPAPAPQRPGNRGRTISLSETNASPSNNAGVSPRRQSLDRDEIRRRIEGQTHQPRQPTYLSASASRPLPAPVMPNQRMRRNPETGKMEVWKPSVEKEDAHYAYLETQTLALRARINGDASTPLNINNNLLDAACMNAAAQGLSVVDLSGVPGYDPKAV